MWDRGSQDPGAGDHNFAGIAHYLMFDNFVPVGFHSDFVIMIF